MFNFTSSMSRSKTEPTKPMEEASDDPNELMSQSESLPYTHSKIKSRAASAHLISSPVVTNHRMFPTFAYKPFHKSMYTLTHTHKIHAVHSMTYPKKKALL